MSSSLADTAGSVLIVEDNPDTVQLYADLLADHGLDARAAANGREGLDRLAEGVPSLIEHARLIEAIRPGLLMGASHV